MNVNMMQEGIFATSIAMNVMHLIIVIAAVTFVVCSLFYRGYHVGFRNVLTELWEGPTNGVCNVVTNVVE